jgi:hypothetical protein
MKPVEIAFWMVILSRREVSTALVPCGVLEMEVVSKGFICKDLSYFKDIGVANYHENFFNTGISIKKSL